jgi:hypothetical protein
MSNANPICASAGQGSGMKRVGMAGSSPESASGRSSVSRKSKQNGLNCKGRTLGVAVGCGVRLHTLLGCIVSGHAHCARFDASLTLVLVRGNYTP